MNSKCNSFIFAVVTPKTSTSVGITTLKTAVDTTTPKTSTSIDTTTPKTSTSIDTTTPKTSTSIDTTTPKTSTSIDTTTPKTSTSISTTTPKPSTVTTPKLVSSTKPPGTANIYMINLPYALFMVSSIIMFIFLFQPVLHDRCNIGRGVLYHVCGMMHIKYPLLLFRYSSPSSGGSGFPLSLSEWSFTICLTRRNHKLDVFSASLNKPFPSFLLYSDVILKIELLL